MVDKFFAAEIDMTMASIDLHETGSIEGAIAVFERELYYYYEQHLPYVRVIHGIGTGQLKLALYAILKKHPLVLDYKTELHGGSTIILI